MKIIIVSDTPRQNAGYKKVMAMHQPDLVIHCGDVEGCEAELIEAAGCPVHMVKGNNDFCSDLPAEEEFTLLGKRCLLVHGHRHYVSMRTDFLREEALQRGIDIVFYGHTHKPEVTVTEGVTLVNPGSLSYPRQEGRKPSYVIMESDRQGQLHFTIAYLE